MEGSSGSPWKKPFNSGALEDTFGVSERNPFAGEASHDSGFKNESDRVVLTQGDHLKNFGSYSGVAEDVKIDPFVCAIECGDISLRQWLDKPERSVDVFKCLQIFRQIVEIVHAAHSQGIVVHNVRPSCFVLEEDGLNSQVIEVKTPQSTCDMHQQRCLERVDIAAPVSFVEDTEENNMKAKRKTEELEGKKQSFPIPMKQVLLMEMGWYTSPEEVAGAPNSCASDIYQLGVLLFELFCPLSSREEKSRTMSSLRHRVLPPQLLLKWPKEASFCLWLVHPEPTSRPTSGELLHSEFLTELRDDTEEEREASIELRERIENQELLLEFLSLTQQKKGELAENLQQTVSFLCSDIEQVTQPQILFKEIHGAGLGIDDCSASSFQSMSVVDKEDYSCLETRKRGRLDFYVKDTEVCDNNIGDDQRNHGTVISKSSRLMKNFKKLESAYFLTRCKSAYSSGKLAVRHSPIATDVGSFANKVVSKERSREGKSPWINPFLEDLHKYLSFSKLKVKADLKQGDLLQSSNLVCALSFDSDAEFFATASVNKKIKIFECDTTMNEDRDIHYPVVEMVSRSKLSSICWNTYIKSQIASSNFEGVVQLWDVTRNQVQSEMREHEQRIWSIDFSSADPTLLASGSDDGSVKLWSINQGVSVGTIKTKANVCCVQFPLDFARSLAFGSADHRIYYYDLRNLKMPVCTLVGHNKTVSYIKFVDNLSLVSASTDNTLKLWDLSKCVSRVIDSPIQSFSGHMNVKNFVGLSVSDGYIATGSETNEVFIYHKAFPMPALSFNFYERDPLSGNEVDDSTQFISSVCWRGRSSTLVAANSTGNVKILEMI